MRADAICPLCHRRNGKIAGICSEILNLPGNTDSHVIACRNCGAYYLWPNVSEELLDELYGKSYFTGVTESGALHLAPSSNRSYEDEFVVARLSKFRETVAQLLAYAPSARTILDIGAATGDFLSIARQSGLSVTGIELSSYACEKAKEKYGFSFHRAKIADYAGTEKFDLVHMNHVFEHFGDPHEALERITQLLSPEGLVYVEVPFQFNFFELLKYRLTGKRKQFDVFSLHHPVFYRPATLKKIFADHGLRCVSLRVFNWARYPASNWISQAKRLLWYFASFAGQGVVIEAFFSKQRH